MRILRAVFAVMLLHVCAFGATTALTGKFRAPSGRAINGYVRFTFPFAGATDTACDQGGSCAVDPTPIQARLVNGVFDTTLPAPRLIRNGDVNPGGTYYRAAIYDSNSSLLQVFNFVIPTGVSTYDVGAALQTSVTTNNVSYLNPANLNGNNTWTGTNTFNGAVVFNSTVTGAGIPCSGSEPANTVCGNNTGSPASPSFVTVTFPMTDQTTIAPLTSPTFLGTPQAPTPALGDNSNKIATTAYVQQNLAAGKAFNPPQRVVLGGAVAMAANTQTNILTETVTLPSTPGTYRLLVSYDVNITAGPNVCFAEVIDFTNTRAWAVSGQNANGTGYIGLAATEVSPQTYVQSATATIHLDAECNNAAAGLVGATVVMNNNALFNMSPSEPTYLSVVPVLTN